MRCHACFLVAFVFIGNCVSASAQDAKPDSPKKLPDGVYAVLRDGPKEKELMPLKDGEALVVDRQSIQKQNDKDPPRLLVVHAAPDVDLDLAGEPKAVKEGNEIVRILLKLKPQAAAALERLTTDRLGKQVAIILGGEVVTVHKIRNVIKGGDVQISCCEPGSAKYLLERLQNRQTGK